MNNKIFFSKETIKILDSIKNNTDDIEIINSKNNLPVPKINNKLLHSKYDPLNDSKYYNFNNIKPIIAIGFSFGYHLNGDNIIYCIPVNYNLLKKCDQFCKLSERFKNLYIITPMELLKEFNYFKYTSFELVIHKQLSNIYPDKTQEILKFIKSDFSRFLSDFNTQRNFGLVWTKNIFKNLNLLKQDKFNLSPLTNDNKQILITGAGPSLDENINFIQSNRSNFKIASSDTSLPILMKYNIIPDFVFSHDASNYSTLHFLNKKHNNIRFLFDITCKIPILPEYSTPIFSNHPITSILKNLNFNPTTLDTSNGNIGEAMIRFFSDYFPKTELILCGIDLSFKSKYLYARHSYIDDFFLSNSSFFQTNEKKQFIFSNSKSKQNQQKEWYSLPSSKNKNKQMTNNIFNLSKSPFSYKSTILEYKKTKQPLEKIDFNYNKNLLKMDNLFKIIETNYSPLIPYFLKIKQEPNSENLNNTITYLKKIYLSNH